MAEKPDYEGLLRFLMSPFLESLDELKTDCEVHSTRGTVWLRVAFSPEDRGRMFGRGGRNIQAIRTVLQATAALCGQRLSLDVFGESSGPGRSGAGSSSGEGSAPPRRRRGGDRPSRRQ